MTIPRLRALHRHWRKHPRVEWLVAMYMKYKAPRDQSRLRLPVSNREDFVDPAKAFGLQPGMTITG